MSDDEFWAVYRAYSFRRPFRPFVIELVSGAEVVVPHPESVDRLGKLYLYRGPARSQSLFTAASVCRMFDLQAVALDE